MEVYYYINGNKFSENFNLVNQQKLSEVFVAKKIYEIFSGVEVPKNIFMDFFLDR